MIKPVYSIRDELVGFGGVTVDSNDASAARGFRESISRVTTPQDYSLYHVADFDDQTGEMIPVSPPALVYRGFKEDSK